MKKKIIIGGLIFLGLGVVGMFLPSEPTTDIRTNEIILDEKKTITDEDFREKMEYFNWHIELRKNNMYKKDPKIIDEEISLLTSLQKDMMDFEYEYTFTEDQARKFDNAMKILREVKEQYFITKEEIKYK